MSCYSILYIEVQIALMVLSTVLFGGFVSMDKNPMLGPHYHALDLMAYTII